MTNLLWKELLEDINNTDLLRKKRPQNRFKYYLRECRKCGKIYKTVKRYHGRRTGTCEDCKIGK